MKIKDIQFEVRSFRFEEPMKVAFATIVDMETCIVRMTTDEGITGFGEAAPFSYVTGDNLETVISVGNDHVLIRRFGVYQGLDVYDVAVETAEFIGLLFKKIVPAQVITFLLPGSGSFVGLSFYSHGYA